MTIGSETATAFTSNVLGQLDGAALVQASSGDVSFARNLTLTNSSGSTAGDITLTTSNQHRLTIAGDATLDAADAIDLRALSGSLSVGGTLSAVTPGIVSLDDGNGAGTIEATTLSLFASGITRQADPDITNLIAQVDGDFVTGDITVPGFLTLDAGGNLSAGNLTAGTALSLSADGDLGVRNATAGLAASFSARGTANFLGTVRAPSIAVSSADINIGNGASLGVHGVTNLLTFDAVSNSPVFIGDSPTAPAGSYVLGNEQGDIRANTIVFNARAPSIAEGFAAAPDVIINNQQIEGSLTPGGGVANVVVNTDGTIHV
jgi:hypothetical protein